MILTLSASGVRIADPVKGPPLMGGFGVACAAIEALTMNLAGEPTAGHSGRLPPARRNPGDLEPVHGGGQAVRGAEGVPRPPRGPDAAAKAADAGRGGESGCVHGIGPRECNDGHRREPDMRLDPGVVSHSRQRTAKEFSRQ